MVVPIVIIFVITVFVYFSVSALEQLYLWIKRPAVQEPIEFIVPTVKAQYPKHKYYVCSGELNWVSLAESPSFAALEAINKNPTKIPEQIIYVDDRGHRNTDSKWKFDTNSIMLQITEEKDEAN